MREQRNKVTPTRGGNSTRFWNVKKLNQNQTIKRFPWVILAPVSEKKRRPTGRRTRMINRAFMVLVLTGCLAKLALAESATVAVASNFRVPAERLVTVFEQQTGHTVVISAGSTGRLYAQTVNGAPFDALLAADAERPRLLTESGAALPESRFTYAVGQLVLWSADPTLDGDDCEKALQGLRFRRLAIANPDIAPYGTAAREVLEHLELWEALDGRLVMGGNIAQAMQFVSSGNADLGLVARSLVSSASLPASTCQWRVPETWHAPIEQQAVQLRRGADNKAAAAFLNFLRGDQARRMIISYGYTIPR
jgi:molybdate transport system substrate-binding protein